MSRALRICWIALLGSVALCHASVQIEWREAKPEDVPTAALAARPEAPPASMPETFRRPVSCRQNTDKIKRALFVFETDAADAGGTVGYEASLTRAVSLSAPGSRCRRRRLTAPRRKRTG